MHKAPRGNCFRSSDERIVLHQLVITFAAFTFLQSDDIAAKGATPPSDLSHYGCPLVPASVRRRCLRGPMATCNVPSRDTQRTHTPTSLSAIHSALPRRDS